MIQSPRPRNLNLTRRVSLLVAFLGTLMAATCISTAILVWGEDSVSAIILSFLGTLGTVAVGLVAALKATEAADTASKAHATAWLTASQTAAIQQALTAHCGEMCPLDACPLRRAT